MSFIKTLETIGKDIAEGISTAAKVPGVSAIPVVGPILTEVGSVLGQIEQVASTNGANVESIEQGVVSALVQAVATLETLKQHAATTVSTPATPASSTT